MISLASCENNLAAGEKLMAKFTVDTRLFRELGELLVGRDSTALVELVKNAYDADATSITVYGEQLEDLSRGFIQVTDDGLGMSEEEFLQGFLRIASKLPSLRTRWHVCADGPFRQDSPLLFRGALRCKRHGP